MAVSAVKEASQSSSEEHENTGLEVDVELLKTTSETVIGHNLEEVEEAAQPTVSNNSHEYAKIFVGALDNAVTEEELFSYFERFGRLVDKVVIHHKVTRRRRGFAFVTYDNKHSAENVLKTRFHKIKEGAKHVEVKAAVPRPPLPTSIPVQQRNETASPPLANAPAPPLYPYTGYYYMPVPAQNEIASALDACAPPFYPNTECYYMPDNYTSIPNYHTPTASHHVAMPMLNYYMSQDFINAPYFYY